MANSLKVVKVGSAQEQGPGVAFSEATDFEVLCIHPEQEIDSVVRLRGPLNPHIGKPSLVSLFRVNSDPKRRDSTTYSIQGIEAGHIVFLLGGQKAVHLM